MKKIVSVVLAIVMVFSITIPVFAQGQTTTNYDGNPVVIVRGIDFAGLTYEDGTKAYDYTVNGEAKAQGEALIRELTEKGYRVKLQ